MAKPTIRPVRLHPPSMARVLGCPSFDSLDALEGICDQRRLIRLFGCTG